MFLSDKLELQYSLLDNIGETISSGITVDEITISISKLLTEEIFKIADDIRVCDNDKEAVKRIEASLLRIHRTFTLINEKHKLDGERLLKSDAVLELYKLLNLPKGGY